MNANFKKRQEYKIWRCKDKMFIIACLRKLIQTLIRRHLKRVKGIKSEKNEKNTEIKLRERFDLTPFNKKQKKVINQGIEDGVDVSIYAKKKYSAEQMLVLYYASMLKVDTKDISSYTMSPIEMEYQLYIALINRYLGKDYLFKLLRGRYSLEDTFIQKKIREDMAVAMSDAYELSAVTLLADTYEEEVDILQKRKEHLQLLNKLALDRHINPNLINLDKIENMDKVYQREVSLIIDRESFYCVDIEDIDTLSVKPEREEILKRKDIESHLEPCLLFLENEFHSEAFILRREDECYLYGDGFVMLKL